MNYYFIFLIFLFSSCSHITLNEAEKLYKEKNYLKAAAYFEKYYTENPFKKNADYSAYTAGIIYSKFIPDCDRARKNFEFLIKNYPESKYYKEANFRAIFCPNYFYPQYKHLYFGDSLSYGKNALEIVKFNPVDYNSIDQLSKIYAGRKLVATTRKKYIISGNKIFEINAKEKKLILKYPLPDRWKDGGIFYNAEIIGKIKVKAGEFDNCLKLTLDDGKSIMVNYYAPEVGRILSSLIYDKKETRIMELLKYE